MVLKNSHIESFDSQSDNRASVLSMLESSRCCARLWAGAAGSRVPMLQPDHECRRPPLLAIAALTHCKRGYRLGSERALRRCHLCTPPMSDDAEKYRESSTRRTLGIFVGNDFLTRDQLRLQCHWSPLNGMDFVVQNVSACAYAETGTYYYISNKSSSHAVKLISAPNSTLTLP